MKPCAAIALLEFREIPAGIAVTDAMIKKAPIALLKSGIISQGRYLTLLGGSTAAVDESYQEGLYLGREDVVDSVFLPDVHPEVYRALLGGRLAPAEGALAVIETPTVACNARAAELALKGTPVELVELRIADSWLDGKGVSVYRGELHDVEAAVEIVVTFLEAWRRPVRQRIIPAPHEALGLQLAPGLFFPDAGLLELKGDAD